MGVVNTNKLVSKDMIQCGESFNVHLSITAAPDIVNNPTDIVLVLDRSGSMSGSPLANLKLGAKKFVEIIDEATDNSQDGQIGSGSHIGIVSFASDATKDTALITSVDDLNTAIDNLSAGGSTNHADAFTNAMELFDMTSSNAKVIVMFTDGVTTIGDDPALVAELAKSQGIIIYCIGLSGDTGLDIGALNDWSSDPDSAYVAVTPDDTELEELFRELAENISKPGATDISLIDTVDSCFKIINIVEVSKGNADIISDNIIRWEMDELGTTASEGAVLEFSLMHVGDCTGVVEVNESIDYDDFEGNIVTFPSPSIIVDCDEDVCVDECPEAIDIEVDSCSEVLEYDAGDLYLDSLGRILEIKTTIKKVCPNRRVALAVIVHEIDENNIEHKRGIKTMVIPAHYHPECHDIKINCIKFILPEELNCSCDQLCDTRRFRVRFIAHYIDFDFDCYDD